VNETNHSNFHLYRGSSLNGSGGYQQPLATLGLWTHGKKIFVAGDCGNTLEARRLRSPKKRFAGTHHEFFWAYLSWPNPGKGVR
jgi:hypothetical protein